MTPTDSKKSSQPQQKSPSSETSLKKKSIKILQKKKTLNRDNCSNYHNITHFYLRFRTLRHQL